MITQPFLMTLDDWASQVLVDLGRYGVFGRLTDDSRWQDWAVQFINNSRIPGSIPNPYQFKNWREWAERFCQTLP